MSQVPEALVNGWEVSLRLGVAARQEPNVSTVRAVLEQSSQGSSVQALLKAILC